MHENADAHAFAVDTTAPELTAEVAAMVAPPLAVVAAPAAAAPPAEPSPATVELMLYRMNRPPAAAAPGRHRLGAV